MRNPSFKKIEPNYRRRALDITLREGKKLKRYQLPFSVFDRMDIGAHNRFVSISIDSEVNDQAAFFTLEDGTKGSFPADLLLYYFDSTYDWSPINQLKRALKGKI